MSVSTQRSLDLPPELLREALALAVDSPRVDGDALGWFPRAAYLGCHEQGRLIVVTNNDDVVGYCVHNEKTAPTRIFLTWVRKDARLILHGRALVDFVANVALQRGHNRIELWCATDLAANLFWEALGFSKICWRWSKGKAHRKHWLWRRDLTPADRLRASHEPGTSAASSASILTATPPLAVEQASSARKLLVASELVVTPSQWPAGL